jgi:hypothetical protein
VVERAIATGVADSHPGKHEVDGAEPQLLERGLEQHIVLEAIASAPATDHLVGEVVDVEDHGPTGARVEVLEHDRRRVGPVDSGEAGLLSAEAEAVEVGTEIEGHEKTLDREHSSRVPDPDESAT